GNIGRLAAEDLHRLIKVLAALQALGDEGVTGRGHGSGAPISPDEKRVLVLPAHALLAFRQAESSLDEALGAKVELADNVCVAAALREKHQAARICGRQA